MDNTNLLHAIKDIGIEITELKIRLNAVEKELKGCETLNWCVQQIKYLLASKLELCHVETLIRANVENIFEHIDAIEIKLGMEVKGSRTCSLCDGEGILEELYTCPKCDGEGKYGS